MTKGEEKDLQDGNEKASCKNELERKCENCEHFGPSTMEEKLGGCHIKTCDVLKEYGDSCFAPKEELVRQDERNKFITLLKSDLETLDKNSKHYNNFKDYIESTIELLEKG